MLKLPNFDCLSRFLRVPSWMKSNVGPGHWHLFNPRSMAVFCERIGLKVVRRWKFFKALDIHSRSAPFPLERVSRVSITLWAAWEWEITSRF